MKKYKKALPMALTLVFSVSGVLTGCTKADNTSGKTDSTGSKNIVIKFYTESDDATNKLRKYPEFIADYEKKNPGVKIEMAPLVSNFDYDEYKKKVSVMLAGGEQIDLIKTATIADVDAYVKANAIVPLDEFSKKENVKLDSEDNGIIPIKGNVYAIPDQVTNWLIFLNKDMLDAAGLPVPPKDWTWDDYRAYAKKLTKGDGASKVYGSYFHNWEWFNAVGIQSKILDNPYFTKGLKPNFDNPIFKNGLKFRYDLENADKSQIPYIDAMTQKMAYRSVFFGGKAAMTPMGAWMVSDIQLKDKYPHTFKTTFATYPRWDKDAKPNTSVADGSGSGWSINANSKHKEEAYKFMRALTTEGLEYGHKLWSAWKKSNPDETIKGIAGDDQSLYDLNALKNILYDPNKVNYSFTFSGPGESEIIDMYLKESESYLVNGQTLDKTIENVQKKAIDIASKAK